MKNLRTMTAIALALGITLTSSMPTFAKESSPINGVQSKNAVSGVTEIGTTKTKGSKTVVSEVLTFDEITQRIAKDNNISINEAKEQVVNNFNKDAVRTAGVETAGVTAYSATYRTITQYFTVYPEYQPSLNFYCQTTEGGYFHAIEKILNVGMNRSYNGMSKGFGGTVYVNLEDPNRIFWIVNGDFTNNGTTTVNGGVNIGLGGEDVINFGISYSTSIYKYHYQEGRTSW